MNNLKKYAAPLGVFALLATGAAALTFAQPTQALGISKTVKTHVIAPGISGTVASVSGNNIILTGKNKTTYTVDATNAAITKIVNGTKATLTVSQIVTGDNLKVSGTVSGTSVTAKTIVDGVLSILTAKQSPTATGTISGISGNIITLTKGTTTYTVDATNAAIMITKPAGTSLANSGIIVGDSITVSGTTTGTNIVATKITDGKLGLGKGTGLKPLSK